MAADAGRPLPAPGAPAVDGAAPPLTTDRGTSPLARVRARAAGVRPAAWILGLTVASAINLIVLGRDRPAPWILPDELIYSELARSFAESADLRVRDVATHEFSFLYSILIAPAYLFTDGLVAGYAAAKGLSAVLFSLAAIPAYLLARRVLSPGWSVVAAALAIVIPAGAYSGGVMTENAFYPVFLTFALVLVWTLERPTPGRQVLVLGLIGVAFVTRAQALALLPALVTAIGLVALLDARAAASQRPRAALGRLASYWPTWLGLAGGAGALGLLQAARGQRLADLLGAYSPAVRSYSPTETARWFLYHIAELDLYLGLLPFAASLLVAVTLARGNDRRVGILVAATAALTLWMALLAAAASAELPEGHVALPPRVHERYVFYVAPLFLTLMLVWISRGLPRPRRATVAIAIPAALLPAVIPYDELGHVTSEAMAALPWTTIDGANVWVLLPSIALALVFLALPRRLALALPLLVAANFFVIRSVAAGNGDYVSRWVLGMSITVERDWIDEAVGSDGRVAALWVGRPEDAAASDHIGRGRNAVFRRHRAIWMNEFFNGSVRAVYHVGPPMLYGLPSEQLTADVRGRLRDASGRVVRVEYVLAPQSAGVRGRERARDPGTGMVLYRVAGPLRLAR